MEDAAKDSAPEHDGVKDGIVGAALGACLGVVIVLLVNEGDRYKAGRFVELRVVGWYLDVFVFCCEDDVADGEEFCLASRWYGHIFAASASKEVCTACKIGCACFEVDDINC